ncbi:CPBP family intramembrane glutamic endopeptidase [Alteribacillus iranensis]|nr:CPBP family intramembrane glutamic endopeptidase [Alteribacillus iranensis]
MMKKIWGKIIVVLLAGALIWKLIPYFSNLGAEYSRTTHFFAGLITTVLTLALIEAVRRMDHLSWKQLGQRSLRTNFFSFLLGFLLWTIPASIGLVICLTLGWVDITRHSDWNVLLMSVLVLCVTVFLIEALPEELIFRGYIYRSLLSVFPHWITVLLQMLLFSLFAYLIGAMYSVEQIQFLPGFAFILGYVRAVSGNVWTPIGFHLAIMTATQMFSPLHGHFEVDGLFTLRFFAFILLPSAIGAIALSFMYPHHKWTDKEMNE